MEYIIVGDADVLGVKKTCMISPCGGSKEHAEEVLDRILNHPTKDDLENIEGHENIRIETVEGKKCWWN